MKLQKTVVLDFDGTLATHEKWKGVRQAGDPRQGAVTFTQELRRRGFKIIIATCRINTALNGENEVIEAERFLEEYLNDFGFAWDSIWTSIGKPVGDIYIDDKGYRIPRNPDAEEFDRCLHFITTEKF